MNANERKQEDYTATPTQLQAGSARREIWGLKKEFFFGCAAYPALELCWRGRTHWTMALAGGAGAAWLGMLSRTRLSPMRAALLGGAGITAMEYCIGRRFNRRYQIWDYRNAPMNLHGQVCPLYAALWCGLSAGVIGAMRVIPARGYPRYARRRGRRRRG